MKNWKFLITVGPVYLLLLATVYIFLLICIGICAMMERAKTDFANAELSLRKISLVVISGILQITLVYLVVTS